jgi:NADH dehydrogenase ubiquinone Fe-S protein 4
MQSGRAGTLDWVLEFEPAGPKRADPLMGWIGSSDTASQVRLRFETREEAIAYAESEGLGYEVELPRVRKFVPKSYSDNFRFGRPENWTH